MEEECLSGEARGLPQFHCGYLWPRRGVGDRLTARCKLTWLAHSLQPSACPSLSLRNVSLGDSDQMQ